MQSIVISPASRPLLMLKHRRVKRYDMQNQAVDCGNPDFTTNRKALALGLFRQGRPALITYLDITPVQVVIIRVEWIRNNTDSPDHRLLGGLDFDPRISPYREEFAGHDQHDCGHHSCIGRIAPKRPQQQHWEDQAQYQPGSDTQVRSSIALIHITCLRI